MWYDVILPQQGFSTDKAIKQYNWTKKIGTGASCIVTLAKHKFSRRKYAIKVLDRREIETMFHRNNEEYAEVTILRKCFQT